MFADAKTSAGAPFVICIARAFEPANEYFCEPSIAGKTSVSEAAANTVTCEVERACAALAGRATAMTTAAARRMNSERTDGPPLVLDHHGRRLDDGRRGG